MKKVEVAERYVSDSYRRQISVVVWRDAESGEVRRIEVSGMGEKVLSWDEIDYLKRLIEEGVI